MNINIGTGTIFTLWFVILVEANNNENDLAVIEQLENFDSLMVSYAVTVMKNNYHWYEEHFLFVIRTMTISCSIA